MVSFLVVVADFLVVVSFFAPASFLVVAVELDVVSDVVVMDSFLLAHDVIKPAAARTATEVISDFFIRLWLTSGQNVQPARRLQALIEGSGAAFSKTCPSCRELQPPPPDAKPPLTHVALQRFCVDYVGDQRRPAFELSQP